MVRHRVAGQNAANMPFFLGLSAGFPGYLGAGFGPIWPKAPGGDHPGHVNPPCRGPLRVGTAVAEPAGPGPMPITSCATVRPTAGVFVESRNTRTRGVLT